MRHVCAYCAVVLDTVIAEVTGREFASHNKGAATDEGLAYPEDASSRVIQRQGAIDTVIRCHVEDEMQ